MGIAALLLIGFGFIAIHYVKPRLGQPGLAMEKTPLTNELGKVVREQRIRLPGNVPGYQAVDTPITQMEIDGLPQDTSYGRKIYWDNTGFGAQLSAVLMKTDRTSIHRPETCVYAQGWKVEKSEIIDIPVALPESYRLKATCLILSKDKREPSGEKTRSSGIYIYWFVSENRMAPGHTEAIYYVTRDMVTTGVLYPWAYVSCFSICAPGQEGVLLNRMKRLISITTPEFQLYPTGGKQTASLPAAGPLH